MTDAHELPLETVSAVLGALNCGALLVDRAGIIIHANERFCEMLGRPASAVEGLAIESFYGSPADIEFVRSRVEQFDSAQEDEFFLPRPDSTQLPVIVSSRPLGDPRTAVSRYKVVTAIDISKQKKMEGRLTEEYRQIAKLSDTVIEQAIDLKHHSERLEQKVRDRTKELREANMEAIYMLAVASEAKDADTGAHVLRIRRYTELLARAMGLPEATAERFGYSAILHDVGKMVVPDSVLKKPGPLTAEERRVIESHTVAGERILSEKPFFEVARDIARSHHENWNGTGYPDQRAGEAIPLAARIVRVVDVYDALLSPRVYKPAWSREEAAGEIQKNAGVLFDPELARYFGRIFESTEFRAIH